MEGVGRRRALLTGVPGNEEEEDKDVSSRRSSGEVSPVDVLGIGRHRESIRLPWTPDGDEIEVDDCASSESSEHSSIGDVEAGPTPQELCSTPHFNLFLQQSPTRLRTPLREARRTRSPMVASPEDRPTISAKGRLVRRNMTTIFKKSPTANLEVDPDVVYGGIAADFMIRTYRYQNAGRQTQRRDIPPDELLRWYRKKFADEDSDSLSDDSETESEGSNSDVEKEKEVKPRDKIVNADVAAAIRLVNRDKAFQTVQMEIVSFWKECEANTKDVQCSRDTHRRSSKFADPSRGNFFNKASEVLKERKESHCLEVELNNLMLMRHLLNGPKAHTVEEDLDEKLRTQKTFWGLFHAEGHVRSAIGTSTKRPASKAALSSVAPAKASNMHESTSSFFSSTPKSQSEHANSKADRCVCGNIFMSDSQFCRRCGAKKPQARLPSLMGSTSRGASNGFHGTPFGSRPQSKAIQRPGSKSQRTESKWFRPTSQMTMDRSKSARMVVTHRRDVHQQRMQMSDAMATSAGFRRNSSIRRSSIPSIRSQQDWELSSSEEDERDEDLDEWLDGGYLDPNYRTRQTLKMDAKVPSQQLAKLILTHSHQERRLSRAKKWLPPVANSMGKSKSDSFLPLELPDRLPPVFHLISPVKAPWHVAGQMPMGPHIGSVESSPDKAAIQYIEICREKGIIPSPFALEMASSNRLLASGKNLQNLDLAALTTMIPLMNKIDIVDLSGNALLGDEALAMFFESCYGWPVAGSLQKLVLESCKGLGRSSSNQIINLLSNADAGLYNLVHLNISSVTIPNASLAPLCSAIRKHGALKQLHMADTGLGFNPNVRQCMAELFLAPELEVLNLGWNSFAVDVFQVIGSSVCAHEKLRTLSLASCSGSRTATGEAPISTFLEQLSHDSGLTKMDVSLNQIDARCALVLEDALENHKALTDLCISQNMLGVDGMRCCLRLLSRNSSGLLLFDSSGCCSNGKDPGESSFKPTHLSGRYDIDLNYPSGRALLRMLYKACERMQIKPDAAFVDLEYTSPKAKIGGRAPASKRQAIAVKTAYHHPSKDEDGVWCVPFVGVIRTTFAINEALYKSVNVEDDDGNPLPGVQHGVCVSALRGTVQDKHMPPMLPSTYIQKHLDVVRLRPGFRKIVPLLMQFRSLKGDRDEQEFLIDALSHDFILKFAHIEQLFISKTANVNVLSKLLPCLENPHERFMALSLAKSLTEYIQVYSECQKFLTFSAENATGHYNLDLSIPSDYRVYQTLVVLDVWEVMSTKRRGVSDMSMDGSWSGIRNAFYQNGKVPRLTEVRLPPHHHLHFDYSSFRRPPVNCIPISDECWNRVLLQLQRSKCKTHDKVIAARCISPQIYIRSVQLRELLGTFYCPRDRTNIITNYVFRLADPQNMKIFSSRLGDLAERFAMIQRLGTLAMFPYFQPEEAIFSLDLSTYEGRLAASLAVHLARQENIRNIRQPSLLKTDGTYFDFVMGIPLSWEYLENVPESGLFQFRYVCSPEERKAKLRCTLAAKHGGWRLREDAQSNTVWWSSLSEAPEAVLTFLYYTLRDFPDVWACFKTIHASASTTSTHMFQEALKGLGWKKFVKHQNLAVKVFRYLDPDNNGSISRVEWSALHQLWKELQLSILEFLQYLDRHFNGNFHIAWTVLDSDGSGEIDRQEWAEVIGLIGYFGESTPIFNYICNHKGRITSDGWKKLKTLWSQRVDLRKMIFDVNHPR